MVAIIRWLRSLLSRDLTPPLQLSGLWTPQERAEVSAAMWDSLMHNTQGRPHWISDADMRLYRTLKSIVEASPPTVVELTWPEIAQRYRIRSVQACPDPALKLLGDA